MIIGFYGWHNLFRGTQVSLFTFCSELPAVKPPFGFANARGGRHGLPQRGVEQKHGGSTLAAPSGASGVSLPRPQVPRHPFDEGRSLWTRAATQIGRNDIDIGVSCPRNANTPSRYASASG